jgi:hypothetical protein
VMIAFAESPSFRSVMSECGPVPPHRCLGALWRTWASSLKDPGFVGEKRECLNFRFPAQKRGREALGRYPPVLLASSIAKEADDLAPQVSAPPGVHRDAEDSGECPLSIPESLLSGVVMFHH